MTPINRRDVLQAAGFAIVGWAANKAALEVEANKWRDRGHDVQAEHWRTGFAVWVKQSYGDHNYE